MKQRKERTIGKRKSRCENVFKQKDTDQSHIPDIPLDVFLDLGTTLSMKDKTEVTGKEDSGSISRKAFWLGTGTMSIWTEVPVTVHEFGFSILGSAGWQMTEIFWS